MYGSKYDNYKIHTRYVKDVNLRISFKILVVIDDTVITAKSLKKKKKGAIFNPQKLLVN